MARINAFLVVLLLKEVIIHLAAQIVYDCFEALLLVEPDKLPRNKMDLRRLEELDPQVQDLIQRSAAARDRAYCPYSKFSVGAAILCADGSIVDGCNVECITLSLTNCAERTALFKAISEGKSNFNVVAIAAANEDKLVSPCGSCRQFLAEFNPRIKLYLFNPDTKMVGVGNLDYFLPHSFNPENVTLPSIKK